MSHPAPFSNWSSWRTVPPRSFPGSRRKKIARKRGRAKTRNPGLYQALSSGPGLRRRYFSLSTGAARTPEKDIRKIGLMWRITSAISISAAPSRLDWPENVSKEDAAAILEPIRQGLRPAGRQNGCSTVLKSICQPLGFCPDVKAYKAPNPRLTRAMWRRLSAVIRVAITGRRNSGPMVHSCAAGQGKMPAKAGASKKSAGRIAPRLLRKGLGSRQAGESTAAPSHQRGRRPPRRRQAYYEAESSHEPGR